MFPRPRPLNRFHRSGAAVALVLLALCGAAAAAEAGAPSLTLDPTSLNFGVMEPHEAKKSALTLTNTGSAELEILQVKSGCSCTAAAPAKDSLMPGESTRIDVTFNSEDYQGDVVKYITIYTSDPDNPRREVMIRAHVHVPIIAFPPKGLRFESVRAGDSTSLGVQLMSEDVDKLEIRPTRWNRDLFEVKVYESYNDKPRQVGVFFSIKPGAPQGEFEEIVRFETNVPGQPYLDYDLKGKVVSDLMVEPERVNFRYAAKNRQMKKMVTVSAPAGNVEFEVTGAEIDLPGFKVTAIKPHPERKAVDLFIAGFPLPDDDPRVVEAKGRMTGNLVIRTDHPKYPELNVRVLYLLKL